MSGLLDHLLTAPQGWVLLVVGLVVFAEDALFVGFVLPGESVAILGGVAANRGHVGLWLVMTVVVVAAVVGDTVGFEVGRHAGQRVLAWPVFKRRRRRLDAAREFLVRRGGWAVFLGRWTAFLRAVMPALAGTSGMPYRTFATFNVLGGVLWGVVVVTAGYLAGSSYAAVERAIGRDSAFVVLAVAVVGLVGWQVRRRRAESQDGA